jgi:phage-related minor tail protein
MLIFQSLIGMAGGGGTGAGFFGSMITQLGKTISGKAAGGPVTGGKPYMVGERGPELFIPGQSGKIMANGAGGSGGSFTVVNNVTVDGSKGGTQADNRNMGDTISRMIAEQTRSTLLKETRPGGILNKPNMATAR